jgi:hypothetical protein
MYLGSVDICTHGGLDWMNRSGSLRCRVATRSSGISRLQQISVDLTHLLTQYLINMHQTAINLVLLLD